MLKSLLASALVVSSLFVTPPAQATHPCRPLQIEFDKRADKIRGLESKQKLLNLSVAYEAQRMLRKESGALSKAEFQQLAQQASSLNRQIKSEVAVMNSTFRLLLQCYYNHGKP